MSETGNAHRVGVIGLGARAETFARQLHAGLPRGRLLAICDVDPDRMAKFCDHCGLAGVRTFTDADAFFAQDDMDAVVITTPDFTHCDVACQAIEAGKHFYLEKPMDVTAERCRRTIRAYRAGGVKAMMGFNMRVQALYAGMKRVVDSGVLGQLVHIECIEQLDVRHSASFMRRYHRRRARSGGLLNTKSCHDLDMMNWCVGSDHKVARVASFGGLSVFTPDKAPAERCSQCPPDIYAACRYKDAPGFVFPCSGPTMHKTFQTDVYGGDLCVYTPDKDIVDNQTILLEWDHGVRGNFNLQLFQAAETRSTTLWGEDGLLELRDGRLTLTRSATGETIDETPPARDGGHGGADPLMMDRFFDVIESEKDDSALSAGLAATLVAVKAEEAMLTGKVVRIAADEYA